MRGAADGCRNSLSGNQDAVTEGRYLPRRGCTHDGEGIRKGRRERLDLVGTRREQRVSTHESPTAIPPHVLQRADMQDALAHHDFGVVFALTRKWAGISYSRIAEACAIKPERVGLLARGVGSITTYEKVAVIADGLRIPGHLLGLAPRAWERNSTGSRTTA